MGECNDHSVADTSPLQVYDEKETFSLSLRSFVCRYVYEQKRMSLWSSYLVLDYF